MDHSVQWEADDNGRRNANNARRPTSFTQTRSLTVAAIKPFMHRPALTYGPSAPTNDPHTVRFNFNTEVH